MRSTDLRATIIAILVLMTACGDRNQSAAGPPPTDPQRVADEPDGGSGMLSGSAWQLEDLGGSGVLDGVQATLEFPEVGKVAGSGSCNRFFGPVETSGESIKFGPIGSTRMACVEAVGIQEGKYLTALQDAERFTLDGPALIIHSRGMDEPLRFIRKER